MKVLVSALVLVLGLGSVASAKHRFRSPDEYFRKNRDRQEDSSEKRWVQKPGSSVNDDSDLVRAVRDRRRLNFIEAGNVVVNKILEDDTDGLQHQRWYVRLSDGSVVFAVYNIDMNVERVPLQMNQQMAMGGEFKWTNNGALLHWLHADPKKNRPDGYVTVNGHRYGDLK